MVEVTRAVENSVGAGFDTVAEEQGAALASQPQVVAVLDADAGRKGHRQLSLSGGALSSTAMVDAIRARPAPKPNSVAATLFATVSRGTLTIVDAGGRAVASTYFNAATDTYKLGDGLVAIVRRGGDDNADARPIEVYAAGRGKIVDTYVTDYKLVGDRIVLRRNKDLDAYDASGHKLVSGLADDYEVSRGLIAYRLGRELTVLDASGKPVVRGWAERYSVGDDVVAFQEGRSVKAYDRTGKALGSVDFGGEFEAGKTAVFARTGGRELKVFGAAQGGEVTSAPARTYVQSAHLLARENGGHVEVVALDGPRAGDVIASARASAYDVSDELAVLADGTYVQVFDRTGKALFADRVDAYELSDRLMAYRQGGAVGAVAADGRKIAPQTGGNFAVGDGIVVVQRPYDVAIYRPGASDPVLSVAGSKFVVSGNTAAVYDNHGMVTLYRADRTAPVFRGPADSFALSPR